MSSTLTVRHGSRSIRRVSVLVVLLLALLGWPSFPYSSAWAGSQALAAADQHLDEVMDKYHLAFDVYTDVAAGGNHFLHRAKMGSQVTIDDSATQVVHTGATAIANGFFGRGTDWGGWSFQNGYMADDGILHENWGTVPDSGYDLQGATKITFWARGAVGGERVEFFAFGVGRSADTGGALNSYPDSEAKVTICGRLVSPCYTTLAPQWREYTMVLPNSLNLHYVLSPFGWVTNAAENGNQNIAFFLDDIRIDKAHTTDLHLLLSFETLPTSSDFDTTMRNVAFTYDNALALIAFTAAADWPRAQHLADALVYAQDHDRWYDDGRLRNAYQAGDLALPPGWHPNGRERTARLPGVWDAQHQRWLEDAEFVGAGTGNIAWAMIGLLAYYEARGGQKYLDATIKLGNWVELNTRDDRGAGGYTGGYNGWEAQPTKQMWKSTEHNLDLFVAFSRLCRITGDSRWCEQASHARRFLEAMWNETGGYYDTGTLTDGVTINRQTIPVDTQSWSLLALSCNVRTRRAIAYAEDHHAVSWGTIDGFDFNDDRDLPWFEGTAQMVLAFRAIGNNSQADHYLSELREAQASAPNSNGKGMVAAPVDGLTTGFTWLYFNRLHVGATSWHILAERQLNPYWPSSRLSGCTTYLPIVQK